MSHTVLILDDDTDFNSLLTDIFEQADYVVTSLEDPIEAVEVFSENHYDLVVTDYKMPEMTGAEFMKEIKQVRPEIPVIMVSGFLENDTIRDLIGEGVGGVFLKPLNIFSLLERTSELIEESHKAGASGEDASADESAEEEVAAGKLGFGFRSFPCKSATSAEFAERLHNLRNFKSTISLIGPAGTHYRLICEDLRSFYNEEQEHFIYLSPASFDADEVLRSINGAKKAGVERITCVVLELEGMSEKQKQMAISLARCEGDFESIDLNLRVVFCVSGDLDDLYDEGLIDENLYILMGTAEVHVPSLSEVSQDVPFMAQQIIAELATERGLSTVPRFDKAARELIRKYAWPRNHDELYSALRRLMEAGARDILTAVSLQSSIRSQESASPRSRFLGRLSSARIDYVRAISVLCGGDHKRTAVMLGTDSMEIDKLIK
ncbi:MAG: sigma-54-dependent transcriptional regulator [Coraliomargarita sp.]